MANNFIGEIRLTAFSFAPVGWALCNGQTLPITGNESLFALLGTTYGGNGMTNFMLPDLRGRVPLHQGQGAGLSARAVGDKGGTETEVLTAAQIPAHTHALAANSTPPDPISLSGNPLLVADPSGHLLGAPGRGTPPIYSVGSPNATMHAQAIGATGGGGAHNNLPPFLGLSFIIALTGDFPLQS
jgi:microcystin-dependent protein